MDGCGVQGGTKSRMSITFFFPFCTACSIWNKGYRKAPFIVDLNGTTWILYKSEKPLGLWLQLLKLLPAGHMEKGWWNGRAKESKVPHWSSRETVNTICWKVHTLQLSSWLVVVMMIVDADITLQIPEKHNMSVSILQLLQITSTFHSVTPRPDIMAHRLSPAPFLKRRKEALIS